MFASLILSDLSSLFTPLCHCITVSRYVALSLSLSLSLYFSLSPSLSFPIHTFLSIKDLFLFFLEAQTILRAQLCFVYTENIIKSLKIAWIKFHRSGLIYKKKCNRIKFYIRSSSFMSKHLCKELFLKSFLGKKNIWFRFLCLDNTHISIFNDIDFYTFENDLRWQFLPQFGKEKIDT